ncbi:MAG: hydrogenase expression/formation protein HypE [Acetobacteraceae bacterium]
MIPVSCPVPPTAGDRIELAHGGGGRMTQWLIREIFHPAFGTSPDDFVHDGAVLDVGIGRFAFSTDSYVVRPIFFPGGDIGSLAINGTVNDLAMCGAEPLYLGVGFVLEEGFALAELRRIVASMREAADAAGIRIVTGDTKVVERGKGDGVYLNTSGVGRVLSTQPISPLRVQQGDAVIVSGDIGRHGIAVMAAREGFEFETPITSDCAPLAAEVRALIDAGIDLHCLRDLTRGGLATGLIEIAQAARSCICLSEAAIPVAEPVRGACEILGFDPLYVANEGRFAAVVPRNDATRTLDILRSFNPSAAMIGAVGDGAANGGVVLRTLGGTRPLDLPSGEQLPRIC